MENNLKTQVEGFASMLGQGKLLEAFDKYYGDNVAMQENEADSRVGKEANRKAEEAFVNGFSKINKIEILGIAVGDNYSVLEYHFDVDHKEYGRINKKQVAIQKWQDNKIIYEKFYYDPNAKLA